MEAKGMGRSNEIDSPVQPKKTSCRVTCCVTGCKNSILSIDERTGQYVRMHTFPDPVKDKERCQQWLINICRADLHLNNIKSKRVCSIHFDVRAYNCPSDIAHSSLLWTAIPTIMTLSDQPKPLPTMQKLKRHFSSLRANDKCKTSKKNKSSQSATGEAIQPNSMLDEQVKALQAEPCTLKSENEKRKKEKEKHKKKENKQGSQFFSPRLPKQRQFIPKLELMQPKRTKSHVSQREEPVDDSHCYTVHVQDPSGQIVQQIVLSSSLNELEDGMSDACCLETKSSEDITTFSGLNRQYNYDTSTQATYKSQYCKLGGQVTFKGQYCELGGQVTYKGQYRELGGQDGRQEAIKTLDNLKQELPETRNTSGEFENGRSRLTLKNFERERGQSMIQAMSLEDIPKTTSPRIASNNKVEIKAKMKGEVICVRSIKQEPSENWDASASRMPCPHVIEKPHFVYDHESTNVDGCSKSKPTLQLSGTDSKQDFDNATVNVCVKNEPGYFDNVLDKNSDKLPVVVCKGRTYMFSWNGFIPEDDGVFIYPKSTSRGNSSYK